MLPLYFYAQMLRVFTTWVLAIMVSLQPEAPWRETYEKTAHDIAYASYVRPLYSGEDGPKKTAALLVAIAKFESNFNPDAIGSEGEVGLFQISPVHAPREELANSETSTFHAIRLIEISARICRKQPKDARLIWYVRGRDGCPLEERSYRLAKHRLGLGERLFNEYGVSSP